MRDWFKAIRVNRKLTQADIAGMASVDVTTISKIELGERQPSVEVAKRIATVLGFEWTLFYQDGDEQAAGREAI